MQGWILPLSKLIYEWGVGSGYRGVDTFSRPRPCINILDIILEVESTIHVYNLTMANTYRYVLYNPIYKVLTVPVSQNDGPS